MLFTKRYRVNLSTSTKGVVTPDQTVEISVVYEPDEKELEARGSSASLKALILSETDELHTALVAKYPVELVK